MDGNSLAELCTNRDGLGLVRLLAATLTAIPAKAMVYLVLRGFKGFAAILANCLNPLCPRSFARYAFEGAIDGMVGRGAGELLAASGAYVSNWHNKILPTKDARHFALGAGPCRMGFSEWLARPLLSQRSV